LYENGAQIDIQNEFSSTPLEKAGFLGNAIAIQWLIEKGVGINASDKYGYTALHEAASYGHYKAVSILLENGADVNALSEASETPLDRALQPRERKYASPRGKQKAADIIQEYGGKKASDLDQTP
jgi:ankyrin repeat protein